MSATCGIYRLTDAAGRSYIGSSINIERRWRQHAHVFDPTANVVLFRCSEDVLHAMEQRFINLLRPDLNKVLDRAHFPPAGPEARAKMALAKGGKKTGPHRAAWCAAIAASRKGKPHPHAGKPPLLRGEDHPRARLTETQVREIRERRSRGETLVAIAADCGVHLSTVGKVTTGKNWRWL